MRLELTRNIKGNEVLDKDIIACDGKVLLSKGNKLSLKYKMDLINNGIYFVYIKDDRLSDIKNDEVIEQLKVTALQDIPILFNNILDNDKMKVKKTMHSVEDLVDYVIRKKEINTNLFEMKTYDNYTYIHCIDTGIMATYLATCLDFDDDKAKRVGMAAMFHDIGKMQVPISIINKKSKLTNDEIAEIRKHPIYGGEILRKAGVFPEDVIMGVIEHHERYDGNGYPFGLAKNEICEFAKIISICDVFTAISADRSYRKKFKPNEAYEYILSNGNIMFDMKYVEQFRKNFYIYPLGCHVKLSNGLNGYVVKQNKGFPDRPIIRILRDENKVEVNQCYQIDLVKRPNILIKDVI